jgi:tetratricopeptide (TPR) repeat protein
VSANADRLFAAGLLQFQVGRLADAEACCRAALAEDAGHAHSLHLLGLIALQERRDQEAVTLLGEAARRRPDDPVFLGNLAVALLRLGRADDAVAACDRALGQKPGHWDACFNRALALLTRGDAAAALAGFDQALAVRPDHGDSWFHRGNALLALNLLAEAVDSYDHAVAVQPDHPDAWTNRGVALDRLGRPAEAVASYDRVLARHADRPVTWVNRGSALRTLRRAEEALASFDRALALAPDHATAWFNRGIVLGEQGDAAAAYDSFSRADRLRPGDVAILIERGKALHRLGRMAEATADLSRAEGLQPGNAAAAYNLGVVLRDQGQHAAALAAFDRAMSLRPDDPDAILARALVALTLGRFTEGWAGYEARWRTGLLRDEAGRFTQPLWTGDEALAGRTLLLHAEQGAGDTLQFCRYAPLAAGRGARVILEVQPSLVRLLRTLPGVAQVIARGDALPPFDLHCPLMSLPRTFGTTLETIPATEPYLHADPAGWRERLAALPRPWIGVTWAGAARRGFPELEAIDRRRSMPLAALAPLGQVPGVTFVSLQLGEAATQPRPDGLMLYDPTAELMDFADTAALVSALDLVITVDTAVAHLAGALGRPVWILNRFDACWRWLPHRDDSPWYPTARLFHQPQPGDWQSVVARVAAALADLPTAGAERHPGGAGGGALAPHPGAD